MNEISLRINELVEKYFDNNNSKFAEKAQTSEANIRNYRKGTLPRLDFLVNIYENLGVSFEWVLIGVGEPIIKDVEYKFNSLNEPSENYKKTHEDELESKYILKSLAEKFEIFGEKIDFIYNIAASEVARKELDSLKKEIEKAKKSKGK